MFFLDCFTGEEVEALVKRITPSLRDNGIWVFADFVLPSRGIRRIVARLVTRALYRYFRWRTGLAAIGLPPSERAIERAGFAPVASQTFAGSLVRTIVFKLSRSAGRPVGGRTGPSGAIDDK
jgi:hypothetical protein